MNFVAIIDLSSALFWDIILPMRILLLHNRYQIPGGEDVVLEQEANMLQQRGHIVELVTVSNEGLAAETFLQGVGLGLQTIWSRTGYRLVQSAIHKFKPDILHVHNFFPLLSPSIYWAAQHAGVPIVQTLHNYRLICANALLLRDERPCELCVARIFPFPALHYRCYRQSLMATLPLTGMQVFHRLIGTFQRKVDAYIALSDFSRQLFIRSGLPASRIHVKPNFVPDALPEELRNRPRRKQIIFVGRLSPEKGVSLLLEAWQALAPQEWHLVIIGDGPERSDLQSRFGSTNGVIWMGWLDKSKVLDIIAQGMALVMASLWYEVAPLSSLEALSVGTPLIAPNHGSFIEIAPNNTGWTFKAGDVTELALCFEKVMTLQETEWRIKSQAARELYEQVHAVEANYRRLIQIYTAVLRK